VTAGRILVVDDDEAIQDFISASLTDEGYEVAVAGNGQSALQLAQDFRPSLILLDMRMPGMNGENFLEIYHESGGYKVPVIALSASNMCRDQLAVLGASDCLPKPFNLTDLMDFVDRWITARAA
jgi:two-component system OmpR family response regulator